MESDPLTRTALVRSFHIEHRCLTDYGGLLTECSPEWIWALALDHAEALHRIADHLQQDYALSPHRPVGCRDPV